MPIQSLNWNDKIRTLASGDNLSDSQKKSLLDQYNTNISPIKNQLGYLPTYGATTNPSRSAVSIVASAYDTSGNGGRKVIRLNNGNQYYAMKNGVNVQIYKSTDTMATPNPPSFKSIATTSLQDVCLATDGKYIYACYTNNNANTTVAAYTDAGVLLGSVGVDTGQTTLGNCSLTYSPTDNTLHAAWASINSTYPNSYNIRYAKGTINADGSVTWGTVTQVTTASTTGSDSKNPSVVMSGTNPLIIYSFGTSSSSNQQIKCYNVTNSTTTNVYSVTSTVYLQFSPSATVDGTGAIHVVWYGYDATDTAVYNVRYSKSTDGGATWSAMTKLTSGNTYHQAYPSITYDQNNNIYVYFSGRGASNTDSYRIRSIIYNGSWGSITDITTNTTGQAQMVYASLCDNIRTFTSPLVIWQDNVSPSVKFSGTWVDTPLVSETTSISAVSNKALIDAIVTKGINGKKYASGTVTSSASTNSFTNLGGGAVSYYSASVSGLGFKPSTIIYTFTHAGYTIAATYSTTFPLNVLVAPQGIGYVSGGGTGTGIGFSNAMIAGGTLSVINGSFVIPVSAASVSVSYLAIE